MSRSDIPTIRSALRWRLLPPLRWAQRSSKHFTLDKTMPGPDHRASLEPDELTAMVAAIRNVEAALGDGAKPRPLRSRNKLVARKSIVTSAPVRRGGYFPRAICA